MPFCPRRRGDTGDDVRRRRQPLRNLLEVEDDSPLASRRLRNHFEHFDERIEKWAEDRAGSYVDSNIGPPNSIGGIDPKTFLRNFDTDAIAITFRGQSYPLQPIVDAARQLAVRADGVLDPLTGHVRGLTVDRHGD